jgi:hypothetical protein
MESTIGQKGFRRSSHKPMNSLGRNFDFPLAQGNTLLTSGGCTRILDSTRPTLL